MSRCPMQNDVFLESNEAAFVLVLIRLCERRTACLVRLWCNGQAQLVGSVLSLHTTWSVQAEQSYMRMLLAQSPTRLSENGTLL